MKRDRMARSGRCFWGRSRSSAPAQVSARHRRRRSARLPQRYPRRRRRSPSGAPRPGARSSRPARAAVFGSENFGNKFPGEAAVYMGIVHLAIYDAAVAIEGGYRPYAIAVAVIPERQAAREDRLGRMGRVASRSGRLEALRQGQPERTAARPARDPAHVVGTTGEVRGFRAGGSPSAAAAIATAAYDTLVGLQPTLRLDATGQAILDDDYAAYLAAIPDGAGEGRTGSRSASRSRTPCSPSARTTAWRRTRPLADLSPPPPGPGVWQPNPAAPGARPSPTRRPAARASERIAVPPEAPNALTSKEYADDFNQVKDLGRSDSTTRTAEQTHAGALLDRPRHPAVERRPAPPRRRPRPRPRSDRADARDGARRRRRRDDRLLRRQVPLLVLAPLPGDPAGRHRRQPGHRGRSDLAAAWRDAELPRVPLRARLPQHRRRRAHSTPSSAPTTSPSRSTAAPRDTSRTYDRLQDVVKDVDLARVLVGFHFRNSDLQGSNLGRKVGGYVADHFFQPLGGHVKREQR